ncbi:MAG TPA: RagB/SusD family nutrient uptake outer membrane protein [Flavitalea sp.]|nr:RagB/SusD family nutrient uptake outer membrane protein [Flavitalea sp.]
MYRHIKNIITILILGTVLLSSCKKELDVPLTSELESTYFENENRVERGIGAIYASLQNLYGANLGTQTSSTGETLHPAWLLQGDDLTTSGTSNGAYEAFSGLSPSNGRIGQIWQKLYFTVNRANFMLSMLETPDVISVIKTPGMKNYNRGEALFLRSWANYRLWDMFRKAPLQNVRINTIDGAVLSPTKNFELLDTVIANLTEAASLLPVSWDVKNKGRIFKNSAYGLLVKCYVMRACYGQKYGGNKTEDYGKAIAAFQSMTPESTIEGVPFGDNFDYRKENNAESLFEYQASWAQKEDNAFLDNNFGGESGGMGAFFHYCDSHWGNYGCGGGVVGPTPKLISMFDPADPRRDETFKKASDVNNVNGTLSWLGSSWSYFQGYQLIKYINGSRGNIYETTWQIQSGNNPRLLRLADVKLAVAEAYLNTGDVSNATKQVNDIRKRARFSTPNGTEAAVPAAFGTVTMQTIMDERLFELAGEEDFRWSDLKRWYAAGYINLAQWTPADFGYPFNPNLFQFDAAKHVLFPIPSSEINSNPLMNAEGNNPGYN